MKKRIISILLALVMVLCLVPTAMAADSLPFSASAGGTALTSVSKTEKAYTYHGWTGDETVDVYTVTVPKTVTQVTLDFGGENRLAYNYMSDGSTYLDGYYDDSTVGASDAVIKVDANQDGVLDYIQVQTPYVGYDSTLLYAVTFCYPDGTTVKPVSGVRTASSEKAAYLLTGLRISLRNRLTCGGAGGAHDWYALGLARAGKFVPSSYYNSVLTALEKKNGKIGEGLPTDYARMILTLTALGYDVADLGDYNLIESLGDIDVITAGGINSVIYALLALNSGKYDEQGLCEKLVTYLLENNRTSDGGWAYSASAYSGEVDITAMAIQALAPYYQQGNTEVNDAVDGALAFLAGKQNKDGAFSNSNNQETAESTAQVIVALTALGKNPANEFGASAIDGLLQFSSYTGGFRHMINDGTVNDIATYQGYYALVAYERYMAGRSALYDMAGTNAGSVNTLFRLLSYLLKICGC